MATALPAAHERFLATLRERHARRIGHDHAYEAMMYHARDPPTAETLAHLVRFTAADRRETVAPPPIPHADAMRRLSAIATEMRWPDPRPLAAAHAAVPDWNTLHLTTFLHTMIPDYPIWGPSESRGLEHIDVHVPYTADPTRAAAAYGDYIRAIKTLREEARFEHVPESHHYLTRIVQSALQELGDR